MEIQEKNGWGERIGYLHAADAFLAEMLGSSEITNQAKRRRKFGDDSPTLEVSRLGDEDEIEDGPQANGHGLPRKKNVDDLLPIGVSKT